MALVCFVVLLGASFNASLLGYIQKCGGVDADYGVAYKHKRALARRVLAATVPERVYGSHDPAGKTSLRPEYIYLLRRHHPASPDADAHRLMRAVILEPYRDRETLNRLGRLRSKPHESFGPIEMYLYELPTPGGGP